MPGVITGLVIQQRNKERVNVFLDGEFACGVSLETAARLRKGQVLSAAELAALRQEGQEDLVYGAALRYVGRRPRSEAEMTRYLQGKGHDAELIAKILDRLRRHGYLDDAAFAQYWVENRNRFRPRGQAALRFELRRKGVEGEAIDEALTEQDDEAAARAALMPRVERWRSLEQAEFEQKAMGHLARRGFSFDICRRVSRAAWEQLQEGEG